MGRPRKHVVDRGRLLRAILRAELSTVAEVDRTLSRLQVAHEAGELSHVHLWDRRGALERVRRAASSVAYDLPALVGRPT